MKSNLLILILFVALCSGRIYAQHTVQMDDGLGHYTIINSSSPGGLFILPSGGGQILTYTPGVSPAWLCGGNTNPTSNILGTLSTTDILVKTNNVLRATISTAPSATVPTLLINNTTPGIQGMRINGSLDAVSGNTLSANPGVWDLVVDGDEVVSGIFKTGGSMWFDGNSATHSITANKPLIVKTTSNDQVFFSVNNTTHMTVAPNGYVGVGTTNPVSALHIVATPPDPTFVNGANFLVPDPFNHVLTVENLASNSKGNGIAIILHNPSGVLTPFQSNSDGHYNNNQSNYMTFYNDVGDHNHIKGRIEGFSYENYTDLKASIDAIGNIFSNTDIYNPLNYFTFNIGYDPNWITFHSDFIHFTPPSFPNFSGGSLPSLQTTDVTFGDCDIACYTWSVPSGINWGSLPSFTGGSFGSLSFDAPITVNGLPLTNLTNPFSINWDFINNIAAPFRDLPYKDKVIMVVTEPVGAAVAFGTSFLGGVTYESGSGDYAEWLERADHNEKIGIGDVVGVVGGKISKNTEGASELMVASWKPCVLGNMPEEGKEQFYEKAAFMGQVPVKMICSVKKGDYILADGRNDGFATAISPESVTASDLDKVLGVAWEDAPEPGVKFVKIAVGLKPHEMVSVLGDHSQRIKNLQSKAAEIDALSAELDQVKTSMTTTHAVKATRKKSKTVKLIGEN